MVQELARTLDDGTVKLSFAGLKEAHRENEAGSGVW